MKNTISEIGPWTPDLHRLAQIVNWREKYGQHSVYAGTD